MNQDSDRLLELAIELLASRSQDDFAAALDRHLPELCPPGAWQIWVRTAEGWQRKLQGRRHQGFGPISESTLDQLTAATLEKMPQGDNDLFALPLETTEAPTALLVFKACEPPGAEGLAQLGRILVPALDAILSRVRLEQQTITDEVSGLFNARHFRTLVDYEMERARRYGQDLSLIFFDLDHFKQVNDTHGHLVGSQVLQQIGHFLRTRTRRVNISCRYGGDEYVLLLPSTSKTGALTLAEKLRKELSEFPFAFDGIEPVHITASFGVASFPGDALSPEKLLQQADRAMYRVKAAGRDGVAAA